MIGHEAIEIIKCAIVESEKIMEELHNNKTQAERAGMVGKYYAHLENCEKEIESCKLAIKALENQDKIIETLRDTSLSDEEVIDKILRIVNIHV